MAERREAQRRPQTAKKRRCSPWYDDVRSAYRGQFGGALMTPKARPAGNDLFLRHEVAVGLDVLA